MLESSETISRFEQAASTKDVAQREAQLAQLTQQLPECNRVLLAWVTLHLDHVTARVCFKYDFIFYLLSFTLSPVTLFGLCRLEMKMKSYIVSLSSQFLLLKIQRPTVDFSMVFFSA